MLKFRVQWGSLEPADRWEGYAANVRDAFERASEDRELNPKYVGVWRIGGEEDGERLRCVGGPLHGKTITMRERTHSYMFPRLGGEAVM